MLALICNTSIGGLQKVYTENKRKYNSKYLLEYNRGHKTLVMKTARVYFFNLKEYYFPGTGDQEKSRNSLGK